MRKMIRAMCLMLGLFPLLFTNCAQKKAELYAGNWRAENIIVGLNVIDELTMTVAHNETLSSAVPESALLKEEGNTFRVTFGVDGEAFVTVSANYTFDLKQYDFVFALEETWFELSGNLEEVSKGEYDFVGSMTYGGGILDYENGSEISLTVTSELGESEEITLHAIGLSELR